MLKNPLKRWGVCDIIKLIKTEGEAMFIDMLGNKRYKINLHTHTRRSDGRVSAWVAARAYREAGYDAIAVTDHWKAGMGEELDGLPIIPGVEYNIGVDPAESYVYHILSLFHDRDPMVIKKEDDPQTCIDKIIAAGGIPVLAHPAWSLNDPAKASELRGIEFTEIYNTVSGKHASNRPYSGSFVDLSACRGKFYGLFASDDTHYYDGDETVAAIMVKADTGSFADLKKAILAGDFYATTGPEVHAFVENGRVEVRCSPCVEINVFTNSVWAKGHHSEGACLTRASVELTKVDKFVRVEVVDKDGGTAYTNFIML